MLILCVFGIESTSVQLPKLSETEENNDETEFTSSKQRLTGRRGMQKINMYSTYALSTNWTRVFHHVLVSL